MTPDWGALPEWMQAHMLADERALGRLEGRFDTIEAKLDQALAAHETRLTGHGSRIRALELWRAGLTGSGVLLAALVSYLLGK